MRLLSISFLLLQPRPLTHSYVPAEMARLAPGAGAMEVPLEILEGGLGVGAPPSRVQPWGLRGWPRAAPWGCGR